MAAAIALAVAVVFALDVLEATLDGVASLAGVAAARRVVATPLDTGVHRALDAVAAFLGAAASAAGSPRGAASAALLASATARRLAAFPAVAHAHGARILVSIALLIRAALGSAAGGAAARRFGVFAESVNAQLVFAAVDGAAAVVVADFDVFGAARLLSHAAANQRAILAGAAAG